MGRDRVMIVDAGRVGVAEAAAIPLYIAGHYPSGADMVVATARISEEGVSAGALNLVWSNERAVRRASGGLKASLQPGDHYLAIVLRSGSLRYLYTKYRDILAGYQDGVIVGLGRSAMRPFIEVYSRREPEGLVDAFTGGMEVAGEDELDPDLLVDVVGTLTDPAWVDPVEASSELVSYRVMNGNYYIGVVGYVEDGLIMETWPDSNIHVYPAGAARGIFKEISMVPPSLPLAFHAANGFLSGVEFVGVDPEHIMEAFRGYITEAERVAGEY